MKLTKFNPRKKKKLVEDKCVSDAKAVVSAAKEHRKQENPLWNILFTKFFIMSFSGFWMRPCVDNNELTKVAQFIFTKTIKYHFNESRNPIYYSKCMCERTFHKDSGRNFQTKNKERKTWAKQSRTCLVTSRAFVIIE